ncbi:MAG: ABC transporter ATP-binding protein [Acidimicrobiia bacterium]
MTPILAVENLSTGYGATTVVREVSLQVTKGQVVCLLGRNGAGKTTLLKALMGLLPLTGTVYLDGVEITRWRGHRISAAGMTWVPQEEAVFPGLTVREHLVIALHGRHRTEEGIAAAATLFPLLGDRLTQEAQTLSGGERKMLSLAQAFIVEPRLILMDEPTEGVAPVVVEQLLPAIEALSREAGVVLVEQNLDTALALGDRAYVLEGGSIVETGEVQQLHRQGVLERRLSL